jgi:hypothetical protein
MSNGNGDFYDEFILIKRSDLTTAETNFNFDNYRTDDVRDLTMAKELLTKELNGPLVNKGIIYQYPEYQIVSLDLNEEFIKAVDCHLIENYPPNLKLEIKVLAAAIKRDNIIYIARRHHMILNNIIPRGLLKGYEQGFITTTGEYRDRTDASRRAYLSNQIETDTFKLFSEQIWIEDGGKWILK